MIDDGPWCIIEITQMEGTVLRPVFCIGYGVQHCEGIMAKTLQSSFI